MPTLDLYQPNFVADAWHQVRAPGGYEWWYFDAEDPATETQIVAILLEGFVFHPGYLRKYAAYRRRPTRRVPPVAGDFPCAYFVVYKHGKLAHQFMTQYRPEQFAASREAPRVRIGKNQFERQPDGTLRLALTGTPWRVTARGPQTLVTDTLSAEFTFEPLLDVPPAERIFLSREMTSADHHWVIANPSCRVEGSIKVKSGDGPAEVIAFGGKGYHDHNYGTGPLGPGLKRWIWGRVLLEGRTTTFHYAVPKNPQLPEEVHLIETTAAGSRERRVDDLHIDWSGITSTLLACPASLVFDDALRLENPKTIDAAPFYARVAYDATVHGQSGTAFCEVAYPHRLRWPVLGRMIEMSIDKRELKR